MTPILFTSTLIILPFPIPPYANIQYNIQYSEYVHADLGEGRWSENSRNRKGEKSKKRCNEGL